MLLVVTYLVYFIPFEKVHLFGVDFSFMNTLIALIIACTKASLVLLVFMHLNHGTKLTWLLAAAGFLVAVDHGGFYLQRLPQPRTHPRRRPAHDRRQPNHAARALMIRQSFAVKIVRPLWDRMCKVTEPRTKRAQ